MDDISATLAGISTEIDISKFYRGLDQGSKHTLVSVVWPWRPFTFFDPTLEYVADFVDNFFSRTSNLCYYMYGIIYVAAKYACFLLQA